MYVQHIESSSCNTSVSYFGKIDDDSDYIVIDLLIVCFDRMQMLDGQGILIMTVGNKLVCIYHSFW